MSQCVETCGFGFAPNDVSAYFTEMGYASLLIIMRLCIYHYIFRLYVIPMSLIVLLRGNCILCKNIFILQTS